MKTDRLLILVVLICGGVFGAMVDTRADEMTIDTVSERLRAWRMKFTTLRLECRRRCIEHLQPRFPDLTPEQLEGFYLRTEFIWSESGLYRQDDEIYEFGRLKSGSSRFSDGKIDHRVESKQNDEQVVVTKSAWLGRQQGKKPITPGVVTPLSHLTYFDRWLFEVFDEKQAKVLREETVDDARCVVIEMQRTSPVKMLLWLDVERNCLPRRVEVNSDRPWTYEVHEFREVEPGFWFPDRGRDRSSPTEAWVQWWMVDVKINSTLPGTLFEMPPLSHRTHVNDHFEHREYVVGIPTVVKPPPPEIPPPPEKPIRATPEESLTHWYFAAAALVLGGVGLLRNLR